MLVRATIVCLLLALSLGALAQKPHKEKAPRPPKPPKHRHHGPQVAILQAVNQTGANQEDADMQSLYARAALLKIFNEKKIEIISPAEVQGSIDQLGVDFRQPSNWTSDNLQKLADAREANYVAGATIVAINDTSKDAARHSAASLTAQVTVGAWLYDAKNHEFVAENVQSTSSYTAKKGEEKLDQRSINYQAVMEAIQNAFRPLVAKLKK